MKLIKFTAVLAMTAIAGSAQAALFDRGGGLIYDDTLNITWLSDANYAKTSGYDADGRMNWTTANTWADGLSYGGYDDWRLPSAINQDGSNPIRGFANASNNNEMGHLFLNDLYSNPYRQTGVAYHLHEPILANHALFTNLQSYVYWASTDGSPWQAETRWAFYSIDGFQGTWVMRNNAFAWAVRDGDVALAPAIPEPETYAMMLAGLGLMGGIARRRRNA